VSDCIFCNIVAGIIPNTTVFEDDKVLAFRDINPKADTHILVIPKQHIVNLASVQTNEWPLVQQVLQNIKHIAEQENLAGYRVITNNGEQGGQEVFHMHWHILAGNNLSGF
jgi:histidine triad (HIT) family protein